MHGIPRYACTIWEVARGARCTRAESELTGIEIGNFVDLDQAQQFICMIFRQSVVVVVGEVAAFCEKMSIE